MDEVEHSQNSASHAATEMNVGLHSTVSGRLAQCGKPGQGSTYLRTARLFRPLRARSRRTHQITHALDGVLG